MRARSETIATNHFFVKEFDQNIRVLDRLFDVVLDMFTLREAVADGDIGVVDKEPWEEEGMHVAGWTAEEQRADIEKVWEGLWEELGYAYAHFRQNTEVVAGREDSLDHLFDEYADFQKRVTWDHTELHRSG